jgi:hypothetical protein
MRAYHIDISARRQPLGGRFYQRLLLRRLLSAQLQSTGHRDYKNDSEDYPEAFDPHFSLQARL